MKAEIKVDFLTTTKCPDVSVNTEEVEEEIKRIILNALTSHHSTTQLSWWAHYVSSIQVKVEE